VYDLPGDYHDRYPALLDAVDASAVAREAGRFSPEHMVVVLVGDQGRIQADLVARGMSSEAASPRLVD
jgi:hypothetical protein